MTLEEAMVQVWRKALVERAAEVELDGQRFPVRETPRKCLREVDFEFDGQRLRGLEQNPKTESRWAQLARAGHKVMQFLSAGVCGQCGGRQCDCLRREEEEFRHSHHEEVTKQV